MSNGREPLYLQIKDYYKRLITSRQLTVHDRIPTDREIMGKFNVSRITVTNALAELVKEGLIYRVPGKGSFVHEGIEKLLDLEGESLQNNDVAHSSNDEKQKVIGLIIPSIDDYFAVRLINGVHKVLRETEYTVIMMFSYNSKEKEQEAIRELLKMKVIGLLIFPVDASTYNEDILELKVRNFPFVLIDRYYPGVETNFVGSDNIQGAMLAVSHLWELGHRNIAICGDSPRRTVSVDNRIKGYMDALTKKEAMINPNLIVTDFAVDYSNLENTNPLHELIKKNEATAFITLNAKLGLYIYKLAKKMNMKIPEDLSIITFDDPYFDADISFFTHIYQSEHEIGVESAAILVRLLDDQQHHNQNFEKKNIEPTLIVKSTTGPHD